MTATLSTDYLVVGAGATALAFIDTLLDETDADIVMVDRYDRPGGHWCVAYDFVRLHQPSDNYGVNSRVLGSSRIDETGFNAGLLELASGPEILGYFDELVREKFIASGRVRYLPRTEYLEDGRIRSLDDGVESKVEVRRRLVDSTYMKVTVPAVTPSPFAVGDGARVSPPNRLSSDKLRAERYVIVGGGKTSIDTVLYLLEDGVSPEQISWVMPRDAWLINREVAQPGERFQERSDAYQAAIGQAWLAAKSMAELFDNFNEVNYLLRLSDEVRPTSFRCATVTVTELEAIRKVTDVLRIGHVKSVGPREMEFYSGQRRDFAEKDVLFVDCTANGLAKLAPTPVFSDGRITLQPVLYCQQVYSAAFIAHIETLFYDDAKKNQLCVPSHHPDTDVDYLKAMLTNLRSEYLWSQDPEIVQWRQDARLAGFSTRIGTPLPPAGPEREGALEKKRAAFQARIRQIELFLEKLGEEVPAESAPLARSR